MLLKTLTELAGVSGNEEEVRDFIKNEVAGLADDIRIDSMGNLIAYKKGKSPAFKVMLSAHMDEVGFMVTGFNEGGTLKFKPVGGIDSRILPGQRVVVGSKKLPGIIGCKPIHLQEREERNNNIKLKSMYIDIGAEKKDEAEKLVSLGDYVVFQGRYSQLGEECVKAKALDDRVGCAILIEMLKESYEFDLYACFTVQEEVGLRGAGVAGYAIEPHMALIIEGTTCSDVPGVEKQDYSTVLGHGPAITLMDKTSYPDKNLVRYIYQTAEKNGIKAQFKQTATGGNDAGKIQLLHGGVKVAVISVPCRYIHSPVSVMSIKDFEGCRQLVGTVLKEFSKDQGIMGTIMSGGLPNV